MHKHDEVYVDKKKSNKLKNKFDSHMDLFINFRKDNKKLLGTSA